MITLLSIEAAAGPECDKAAAYLSEEGRNIDAFIKWNFSDSDWSAIVREHIHQITNNPIRYADDLRSHEQDPEPAGQDFTQKIQSATAYAQSYVSSLFSSLNEAIKENSEQECSAKSNELERVMTNSKYFLGILGRSTWADNEITKR